MAVYPLAPRFAKMLCLSLEHDILSFTIAIVAALSVQQVLLQPSDNHKKMWHSWVGRGNSLLLGEIPFFQICLPVHIKNESCFPR